MSHVPHPGLFVSIRVICIETPCLLALKDRFETDGTRCAQLIHFGCVMKIRSLLLALVASCGFCVNLCPASVPSWTNSSAPYESWNALASSADGNVLVAAVGGGNISGPIYISMNSGMTWMLTSAPQAAWTSVAASADGSQLVAAAGGSFLKDRIYLSSDFGATWTATSAPITNWSGIASSADGTKLVAVSGGNCAYGPIFTSTDSGTSWTMTSAPIKSWWSVASSADGAKLVSGTVGDGIYLSSDSGATWTRTIPPVGWWWTVTISADGSTLVAAEPDGQVYVSLNWGTTWNLTSVPHNYNGDTAVASSDDGTKLMAVVNGGSLWTDGIFTSPDSGTTWITNTFPDLYFSGGGTVCAASSADGTKLVAAFGNGPIFTWQAPRLAAPLVATLAPRGTNGDVTLNGSVNPNDAETWAWFEWDASPAFGNDTAPVAVGSGWNDITLSTTLSGLFPGVACYFRLVAVNDLGLSIGQPVIYQAPQLTLLGDNPMYLICSDTYTEPGSTVSALPVAIAAGEYYGLALKANRTVVGWGNAPAIPPDLTNVVTIAAGNSHGLALKNNGTVVAWGDNTYGGTNVPENLDNVVAVTAGFRFSLALKSDGTVVGWGLGATNPPVYDGLNFGQAMAPEGLSNVVDIAAGFDSSLALKSDGTVVGWGDPAYGGTSPPAGLSNVVAISAGAAFGLALKSNGKVVGWGFNESNQTNIPTALSNVVAIAAGYYHGLALKDDGTIIGWGDDSEGQASPPTGLSNVVAIAAGTYHSLAMKSDGTVVGWGLDSFGGTDAPTNLVNSLGAAEVVGAVYGYTPGTYVRAYTAINPQGGVAKATRTVYMLGALETEQRVLAQMIGLKGKQKIRQLPQLDLAIARLNRALATNLWVGDMYLADRGGLNVFAEDAMVVFQLSQLMRQKNNAIPVPLLQEWQESLVKAARLVAIQAIQANETTPGGGYSSESPYVTNQMIKGDQAAAAHQYVIAILHYWNAWNQVIYFTYQMPLGRH